MRDSTFDDFGSIQTIVKENIGTQNATKTNQKHTRHTIGAKMNENSMHVKSEVSCINRYGSKNKINILKGKVIYFEMIKK